MEPFEEENPFDNDTERVHSETSSSSQVNLSEPASPPSDPSRVLTSPPTSPSTSRPTFPSSGSHRLPQVYKNAYCCNRAQWLHSGEDVEILVCDLIATENSSYLPPYILDNRCSENVGQFNISLYRLHHTVGGARRFQRSYQYAETQFLGRTSIS